jgi:hypothetical protein
LLAAWKGSAYHLSLCCARASLELWCLKQCGQAAYLITDITVQGYLLLWLYLAVHGFAMQDNSSMKSGAVGGIRQWPDGWRETVGQLAARGTPESVMAGGLPQDPQVNAGAHSPL